LISKGDEKKEKKEGKGKNTGSKKKSELLPLPTSSLNPFPFETKQNKLANKNNTKREIPPQKKNFFFQYPIQPNKQNTKTSFILSQPDAGCRHYRKKFAKISFQSFSINKINKKMN
jgi:hypothetical protein